MSTKVASLIAEIGADTKGFDKGASGVMSSLVGMAGRFISTTAVIGGLEEALRFSVNAAAESESVNAKLNAVLASTGGVAGMTAGELDKMASSLSRVSTYDDEAIKSSEALMLTFTKIGSEVFPQAEQAALDMSTALGQDLQSSTLQLGKALNDPITGITALSRTGVSFTAEQKKMIETLVKSGNTLDAQKIILQELSKEFGGQALAASKTYAGQLAILKNEFGNVAEEIGMELIPALKDMSSQMVINLDEFKQFRAENGDLAEFLNYPISTIIKWTLGIDENAAALDDATTSTGNATASTQEYGQAALDAAAAAQAESDALKEVSKNNEGILNGAIDLTKAHKDFATAQDEYIQKQKDLQIEKDGLYSWEVDKIKDIEAEQGTLRDEYQQTVEDFKRGMEEKFAMMAIEKISMQDGVAGFSDAEMQKAQAVLETMDVVTGAAMSEQLAMEKLTGAVSTGQISVQDFGRIIDEAMADGVVSIDEVNAAIARIPSEKTIDFYLNAIQGITASGDRYAAQAEAYKKNTHASGGDFMIPMSYGNEGFQMGNGDTASGGERVSITPRNQSRTDNMAAIFARIPTAQDNAKALGRELMKLGIGVSR